MTLGVAEVREQEKKDIGELTNQVVSAYDRVSGRAGDRLGAEDKAWIGRMKGWMHGVVERRRQRFEKMNEPVVVRERDFEWKEVRKGDEGRWRPVGKGREDPSVVEWTRDQRQEEKKLGAWPMGKDEDSKERWGLKRAE